MVAWSDYSGLGGFEIAWESLFNSAASLARLAGADVIADIHFHRASDCWAVAQQVLVDGPSEHVFGNLLHRAPKLIVGTLKLMMKEKQIEFKRRSAFEDPVGLAEELGTTFMKAAHTFIASNTDAFSRDAHAYCVKHGRDCPVFPTPHERDRWPVSMACAGTTCTSWSTMGKKNKWLANSAIVFLLWAHEQLAHRPTFIIHECVAEFDISQLIMVFGALYLLRSFVFCPTDVGLPARRPRRWSLLILKSHVQPLQSFDAVGFGQLFFRDLGLTGHDMFVAPKEAVMAHTSKLALQKYLPELQSDGTPWDMRDVLSESVLGRLISYERQLQRGRRTAKYIVNLCQNPSFFRSWSELIPTLLTRTSQLWSMSHKRIMIPLEHLAVQGIDVWGTSSGGCHHATVRSALAGKLTDGQIRHLSGNSFNIAQISSVLLFAFALSRSEGRSQ